MDDYGRAFRLLFGCLFVCGFLAGCLFVLLFLALIRL